MAGRKRVSGARGDAVELARQIAGLVADGDNFALVVAQEGGRSLGVDCEPAHPHPPPAPVERHGLILAASRA
jgi:hypothetical protein